MSFTEALTKLKVAKTTISLDGALATLKVAKTFATVHRRRKKGAGGQGGGGGGCGQAPPII